MAHFTQHLQTLDTILYQIRYRDPQRIRGEVADILMKPHVASLTPQSRPLVRPPQPGVVQQGPQQLLCLVGTLPIVYNGANYNIPINLWIVGDYPYAPPVVYVTPTADMAITPRHRHVDLSGMVYHPYLSAWNMATCNLLGLIASLSSVFSAEPPVRSQAPAARPTGTGSPTPAAYSNPTYPPSNTNNPPPPYGTQSTYNPNNPAPSSYSLPQASPYAQPQNQPPPPYQYPPNGNTQQRPPPPPYQQPQTPPPSYPNPPEYTPPKTEDPAVVEKRNLVAQATEKLTAQLRTFHTSTSQEIDKFVVEQKDVEEVGAHFDSEKTRIQKELDQSEQETKALTDKLEELSKWLEENDKDTEPDIDTITDPKDALAKQLLGLVATDATIQDLCFYLDKALANDKISLDAFLKTIRSLSREQFQVRATMKKVETAQRAQLIQQQQQQVQQQVHQPPVLHQQPIIVPQPHNSPYQSASPYPPNSYPQRV